MEKDVLKEAIYCEESIRPAAERFADWLDKLVAEGAKPVVAREYKKFLKEINEQLDESYELGYERGQDSMVRDPYGPM